MKCPDQNKIVYYLSLLLTLCLFACNNEKYLSPGQYLYNGAELKINLEGKVDKKAKLKQELEALIYPEPNSRFLGARTKLWFYNITEEPKKNKGFKYWAKYKLGEPPVLMKNTDPERVKRLMKNHLVNSGYFRADADYKVVPKEKEAKIVYSVSIDTAYKINEIHFPEAVDYLTSSIANTKEASLLHIGENYDLSILEKERQRISKALRSEGFYFFEEEFLKFNVDSTIGKRSVDIYLRVKNNIDEKFLQTYRIGKIFVYPNFSLDQDSLKSSTDTLYSNGCYYLLQDSGKFRPEIITDAVFHQSGKLYNLKAHNYTLQRLIGLGAFQFVNIEYKPDADTSGMLTTHIYLTPFVKKSLRLELSVSSKSNGFTGPGFNTSFRNRNALRGSELFIVNVNTGYETQISGAQSGLNSFELGLSTELLVPRFITPFEIRHVSSRFIPKTSFKVGFRILKRVKYFRTNSYDASIGYKWRESETKLHELFPLSFNFVNLANAEPIFDSLLDTNPLLRRSFEEQFILGSIYSYTFNSKLKESRRNEYYFKGTADIAGNLIGFLGNKQSGANQEIADSNFSFAGVPFSQYLKFETIFKHYFNISERSQLASRFIAGVGIPTGDSEILPYIKQFFAGGSNSIRAFHTRSLGPGIYRPKDEGLQSLFLDQAGDIKLEVNTEYRFTIFEMIKGAFFLDVGNIWLANEDPDRPGGKFEFNDFMNELAVGTGFGIRVDPDFFVLRFDFGFPLRIPYLPEGKSWVSSQVDFASSEWRKENVILNIAIGYPF